MCVVIISKQKIMITVIKHFQSSVDSLFSKCTLIVSYIIVFL